VNVVFLFVLLICSNAVWSYNYPQVYLKFLKKPATQVYLGESVRVPIEMTYYYLRQYTAWKLPTGSQLEIISGSCPPIPVAYGDYENGVCYMNLVFKGISIGAKFSGTGLFWVAGNNGHHHDWNWPAASFDVNVTVIPHCPVMLPIAHQSATANQNFTLNLKPYIKYYNENFQAKKTPQMTVVPAQQDGLRFDPASYSLVGKPERIGKYAFKVSVKNEGCTSQTTQLSLDVKANLKDKPVFKTKPSLAAGFANHKYHMNLMELIQPTTGFMVNNQVHFRIDNAKPHPNWLNISTTDATKLVGLTPDYSAGTTVTMSLFASTNTGGDSAPLLVNIPIGYDSEQKPKIEPFNLSEFAGKELHVDISKYIVNPGGQPVQLYIDKVEPLASWLSHSQTTLMGSIPPEATGQLYQLTLRASTVAGGSSKPIKIPCK
jgi:hypothetical protein